ncbi:TonB family protein [Hymenobacter sp. GOD-10R]|uniref:energy transducer TonB n=1 Tax=Hymenobacter sp. GOD-10R TaxID=3093922 RepID=UPI002D777C34|nr:TonB family protein [Hymenobacter sp. GOD-10R]WRQ27841.1 TonB family protein [Hymenobacter sp. GOD-10R]
MTLLNLLTATLDDIVFERRNKAYGAFLLRKLYNRHLATAITIASALAFLLVAVPMLVQQLWPAEATAVSPPKKEVIELYRVILPPKQVQPAALQPKAIRHPMVKAQSQPSAPKVVADNQVKPEIRRLDVAPPVIQPGAIVGTEDLVGDSEATNSTATNTTGTVGGATATETAPSGTFTFVEVMPEFSGGQEALRRYMQRNLHYPSTALANNIAGKVFVSFVVNADGTISNVEILKGLGYGTDEEAIRVVRSMPSWKPGRQNNHPVSVRYTMPITFRYE